MRCQLAVNYGSMNFGCLPLMKKVAGLHSEELTLIFLTSERYLFRRTRTAMALVLWNRGSVKDIRIILFSLMQQPILNWESFYLKAPECPFLCMPASLRLPALRSMILLTKTSP